MNTWSGAEPAESGPFVPGSLEKWLFFCTSAPIILQPAWTVVLLGVVVQKRNLLISNMLMHMGVRTQR